MDTFLRKHAHLVKVGEVIQDYEHLELVLESNTSWDGGVHFRVLDLEDGRLLDGYFAPFDEVDVLA